MAELHKFNKNARHLRRLQRETIQSIEDVGHSGNLPEGEWPGLLGRGTGGRGMCGAPIARRSTLFMCCSCLFYLFSIVSSCLWSFVPVGLWVNGLQVWPGGTGVCFLFIMSSLRSLFFFPVLLSVFHYTYVL